MKYNAVLLVILSLFVCSCQQRKPIVAIQPLKKFNNAYTDTVKATIEKFYGYDVVVLEKADIPGPFFTRIKSPRYRADSIISWLRGVKQDTLDFIIGLTELDISTTKYDTDGQIKEPKERYSDWGVFGLGYRPGPSAVVSTYRIRSSNKELSFQRLKKIALHELGHNLGLPHCKNEKCFMQDAAESIKTIDKVEIDLCRSCRNRI